MKLTSLAFAAVLLGATALSAHANVVASAAFSDLAAPTLNTNNLFTATSFTIGEPASLHLPFPWGTVNLPQGLYMTSSGGALGNLYTTGQYFGPITIHTNAVAGAWTADTGVQFGSAAFGAFQSTEVFYSPNATARSLSLYVLGQWTPGTYGSDAGGPETDASFVVILSQVGGAGTVVADSASFAVPPAPIPEASTWAMMGLGFAGLGFAGLRSSRKRRVLSLDA